MAIDVEALMGPDGWATGPHLLQHASRRSLATWVGQGRLVPLGAGRFALPDAAGTWRVRAAAAVEGREAVLSHDTALAAWELVEHPRGPVHITTDAARSGRGPAGVVVHRSDGAWEDRRRVRGLPVSPVERAVVDTWGRPGGVPRDSVRAAAITAVRRRMCSPADLAHELARSTRLPGRAELTTLVGLLAAGCQSELEIWGCLHLLRGPGMPDWVRQRRTVVAGEVFFLDAACEELMLAVELDGAAWHGSQDQRERDIRRDALLATVGWQTLRFGYRRVVQSTVRCRQEILAVVAARRRLRSADGVR